MLTGFFIVNSDLTYVEKLRGCPLVSPTQLGRNTLETFEKKKLNFKGGFLSLICLIAINAVKQLHMTNNKNGAQVKSACFKNFYSTQ